jgi:hypothetical protein
MSSSNDHDSSLGVSRRTMLKRGATVGVATAWVVPIVQAVSMTPAHADTASAPAVPHQPQGVAAKPPSGIDAQRVQRDSPGPLAETGPGIPLVPAIAVGAGAVVLGVGAIALGATRRSSEPDEDEATPT